MDTIRNLRIACAAIIVLSFFLPWVALFGATLSGYKIVTIGGDILFLYPIVIVILSIVTILVELVYPPASHPQRYSLVSALAGISPFIALFYGFSKIGDDLFRILSIGSYLTLISGVVLIIVGVKSKSIPGARIDSCMRKENLFPNNIGTISISRTEGGEGDNEK